MLIQKELAGSRYQKSVSTTTQCGEPDTTYKDLRRAKCTVIADQPPKGLVMELPRSKAKL